ncbi:hypothetical protein FHR24_000391 [Wenyingzhuangia heitensis]|uniref:DUF4810 domain-containing protein n=1 Tax=Wenyingzhuangia heitensis TaxID=1487859 RepID=A0ABX0UA47_9FLAO|nr:DUF4810 domain-containing protein [Wenyingzhuangia heitensis]NIJ43952.1 hypothetical protein [Wenyingzhuangia heitensis]
MLKKLFYIGIIPLLIASCTTPKNLYIWNNYDQNSYDYLKSLDEESLAKFEATLKELIEGTPRFKRDIKSKVAPGICADYGYFLLKKGNREDAIKMFKQEIVLYPESKLFIDRILKKLEDENS